MTATVGKVILCSKEISQRKLHWCSKLNSNKSGEERIGQWKFLGLEIGKYKNLEVRTHLKWKEKRKKQITNVLLVITLENG